MTVVDYLFVALFAIVHPLVGFISFRGLMRRVAAGEVISRSKLYYQTIALQWSLFVIGVIVWANSSRPWSDTGVSFHLDGSFALGLLLVVAVVGFLLLQNRNIRNANKQSLDDLASELGFVATMVPRNGSELARFYGVSVTAGIVEELLWRGMLIWFLSQFMPLWAAAVLSTIGFAIAHSYQGLAHVPGVLIIGSILAGLYVLTGSIWLPIALHILVDVLQGQGMYQLMQRRTALAA